MTFLEHGLYGGAITYAINPELFWVGVIVGMLPDLPWFIAISYVNGPKKVIQMLIHKDKFIKDNPQFVYVIYYLSHSFVTASILFAVLYLLQKELAILAIAYAFHILCDIPLHQKPYATRFLYPLSNFHFNGYSQREHRWVLIAQYPIIALIYLYLFFSK